MKIFGKEYPIVSEEDQKNKKYTLYLYIEKVNGVVYAKFGEVFCQTIWDRYNSTGDTQHSKQIKVWESSVHDKLIHKVLRDLFKWAGEKADNPLNTNEAYIVESAAELDSLIDAISDIVKIKKTGPDFYRDRFPEKKFTIRSYQNDVIEKAKKILSVRKHVLLYLLPRSGKSFVSLKICKDLGAKNILILTPFPAAEDSFKRLGCFNEEFRGYKYIHLTAETKADDFFEKNIVFCSYQFYDENKKICQKMTSSINFDFVILDECHNTSDSERTKKILKKLYFNKLIYMSGTPFNDIYSGYFTKCEVVAFDYLEAKKYEKTHPNEINLPNLHIKNVCNIAMLQDQLMSMFPTVFKDADAFEYPIIFSDEQHAEAFFTWKFQSAERNPLIVNKARWFDLSNQKRIIAFFSTTAQVDVAKKALKKVLPNYKILSVSGKNADFTRVNEKEINEAFEDENTIILSCGKLTTGVTLPKLDTIWYFKNTASTELFVQTLFRIMTPCKGKTDVTMYCFDSEASLKVLKEYIIFNSNIKGCTVQSSGNDIFSCVNFTYLTSSLQWKQEDPDVLFEKIRKLPYAYSPAAVFQDLSSFNGVEDLGTDELKEKYLTITKPQGEAIRGQCDRNNNLKQLLKKHNSKSDMSPEEEKRSDKQLLKILLNFDKTIFVNGQVKTYKDLEKLMPKELKGYEANYKQLLEDNKVPINQLIEDIHYKESHGMIEELLQSMSFSNSTDMKTPEVLLEKMFAKFSDNK